MKRLLLVVIIFIPIIYVRYLTSQPHFRQGDRVRITAQLAEEPKLTGSKQLFTLSNLRIFTDRFPEFHYGNYLVATGTVAKVNSKWQLEDPKITRLETANPFSGARSRLVTLLQNVLPEPESALVAGVTFGVQEQLPAQFKKSLISSGTLHVVVASGMNITITTHLLMYTLILFFSRRTALIAALGGIWLYILIIGIQPAIVRAALMGTVAFTGQATGRLNLTWWALLVSALVMLLVWPWWIGDIGFWLSFAATSSIVAFSPLANRLVARLPRFIPSFVKQDLATSSAAWIGTAPLLLAVFGQFTPWAPFVNMLVLWTVAPMMVIGFLGSLVGLVFEPLGRLILLFAYPLAFVFVKIVELF